MKNICVVTVSNEMSYTVNYAWLDYKVEVLRPVGYVTCVSVVCCDVVITPGALERYVVC